MKNMIPLPKKSFEEYQTMIPQPKNLHWGGAIINLKYSLQEFDTIVRLRQFHMPAAAAPV